MATNREQPAKRNPKPAEVRMIVTQFKDVLTSDSSRTGRSTGYAMRLTKRDPRVSIKGDVILVKSPGATLRFTLASSPGDKETYFAIGITFVRQSRESQLSSTAKDCNNSDEQRLGLLNFPQRKTRVEKQTLSITDSYRDKEKGVLYKFSIVIQRGSDGKIGIIDPGIAHDNSGFH